MPNLTLAIPDDLKARMSKFPEINWSEVARQAIVEKTRTLEQMQRLLAHSALTDQEALAAGQQIKRRVWRKHRRLA
jgi:capsid protein